MVIQIADRPSNYRRAQSDSGISLVFVNLDARKRIDDLTPFSPSAKAQAIIVTVSRRRLGACQAIDRAWAARLGIACRSIPGWGDQPAQVASAAKEKQSQGYKAIKMNACAELQYIDSPAKLDEIVQRVESVREAVGNDFGIAVDFHGRVQRGMAKTLVKELDSFRLMFIEEPVLSEHLEA